MYKCKLIGFVGLLAATFSLLPFSVAAAESYKFRIYLKDKGETTYSVERPEQFLSEEAVMRKKSKGTEISVSDMPISTTYLDFFTPLGAKIVTQSKWFATVVVETQDSLLVDTFKQLAFVDSVKWIWKGTDDIPQPEEVEKTRLQAEDLPLASFYGYAEKQINLHNGQQLHSVGFRGKGMRVAVIDAGFMNVDQIAAFDSLKLKGTRNFVFPDQSVYWGDDHGTKVLSCMAANLPGVMVGTAPEAEYWLLKSEDSRSEFPVEEDYWVAAVEFADSVGVDVITSSLGYFSFDNETLEYGKNALDGKTALISKAACMAAQKGILLFSSAGNEGSGKWEKITFPADAFSIVTVGAITERKHRSIFSSKGFTADLRIKPDVVALGSGCCVIDPQGNVSFANGTSFATPILAGLAVCLWQALPHLSNNEMIKLLQETAHQYNQPDVELGYGIPDIYKAYKLQRKHISLYK